jgi:hypothetical protein
MNRRRRIRNSIACFTLVLAGLVAIAPASAKTDTQCKQEYAAKKAHGEPLPRSQRAYLKACLAAADPAPAARAEAPEDEERRKIRSPIS